MSGHEGTRYRRGPGTQRREEAPRKIGLYCPNCLTELVIDDLDKCLLCERCGKKPVRERVLNFDERVKRKFEAAKRKRDVES